MKAKYKIIKVIPDLSDSEIREYMDFKQILDVAAQKTGNHKYHYAMGGAMLILLIVLTWWSFPLNKENEGMKNSVDIKNTPDVLVREQPEKPEAASDNIIRNKSKKNKRQNSVPKDTKKEEPKSAAKEENIVATYENATPVAGMENLYDYFARELHYPKEAVMDSVKGTTEVLFTINTSGRPEGIRITKSLGPLFDKEAIRLITNMPAWQPAKANGTSVASKISIPLHFGIK